MDTTQKEIMIGMLRAGLEMLQCTPDVAEERYTIKIPGSWLRARTPSDAAQFIDPQAVYCLSVLEFFRLFNYIPPGPPRTELPLPDGLGAS